MIGQEREDNKTIQTEYTTALRVDLIVAIFGFSCLIVICLYCAVLGPLRGGVSSLRCCLALIPPLFTYGWCFHPDWTNSTLWLVNLVILITHSRNTVNPR